MQRKGQISIQEVMIDFESMIRHEERIITLNEIDQLSREDCAEFHHDMIKLAEKYLPNYKNTLPVTYTSDSASEREKGRILFNILQKYLKEVLLGLR